MARSRAVTYKPNLSATRDAMTSAAMVELVIRAAMAGKTYAESISPVDTGRYRDSFQVSARIVKGRALAVLDNTTPYAVVVEVYNHGGERILGRTVDYIENG